MKHKILCNDGRDEVVGAVRREVKAAGGKRVGLRHFLAATGMKKNDVFRHFPRWEEALAAAGVEVLKPHNEPIEKERLLEDFGVVARRLKKAPTRAEYKIHGKYAAGTVEKPFGKWSEVRGAFVEFAGKKARWADVKKILESGNQEIRKGGKQGDEMKDEGGRMKKNGQRWRRALVTEGKAWVKCMRFWPRIKGRTVYGEVVNFPGLRHGPLNEQGVVFVFGLLAERLGFAVEAVGTRFPDCEAFRRMNTSPETWRKVKIEFEYESRNFRDHGHDAAGCDLIVCRKHNWAECPKNLEVIALRDFVARREMTNDE